MAPNKYNFESPDDERVASMLGMLPRVEAPADFDLRLKARIARSVPAPRPFPRMWLRLAALPVLLFFAAGIFFFSGIFSGSGDGVPPVADVLPDRRPEPASAAMAPPIDPPREVARDAAVSVPAPIDAVSRTTVARRDRPTAKIRESGSLSFDTGLGITNKVIQPRGIPVDPRVAEGNSEGAQTGGISVKDLLTALGIAADRTSDGWAVKGLTAKSQAERSGVLVSDVVEAVGIHDVKGKDSLQGGVSADSITVLRGGKRVVIKLAGR